LCEIAWMRLKDERSEEKRLEEKRYVISTLSRPIDKIRFAEPLRLLVYFSLSFGLSKYFFNKS
jgi:hypothetical protein